MSVRGDGGSGDGSNNSANNNNKTSGQLLLLATVFLGRTATLNNADTQVSIGYGKAKCHARRAQG